MSLFNCSNHRMPIIQSKDSEGTGQTKSSGDVCWDPLGIWLLDTACRSGVCQSRFVDAIWKIDQHSQWAMGCWRSQILRRSLAICGKLADTDIHIHLHPRKLTCPLKSDYFNRKCIFQPLIFRGHGSFPGSSSVLSANVLVKHQPALNKGPPS